MKWIKYSDEKPNGSYYYVIYYDIENGDAVFYKKDLVDLAYEDEFGWNFADDTPIVFDDEKLVIKYWISVPDLPKED